MRLTWEEAAKADRREIRAYISRHNPRAARFISKLLLKQALRLKRHPHLGYPGRASGTREWVAHPEGSFCSLAAEASGFAPVTH